MFEDALLTVTRLWEKTGGLPNGKNSNRVC